MPPRIKSRLCHPIHWSGWITRESSRKNCRRFRPQIRTRRHASLQHQNKTAGGLCEGCAAAPSSCASTSGSHQRRCQQMRNPRPPAIFHRVHLSIVVIDKPRCSRTVCLAKSPWLRLNCGFGSHSTPIYAPNISRVLAAENRRTVGGQVMELHGGG